MKLQIINHAWSKLRVNTLSLLTLREDPVLSEEFLDVLCVHFVDTNLLRFGGLCPEAANNKTVFHTVLFGGGRENEPGVPSDIGHFD